MRPGLCPQNSGARPEFACANPPRCSPVGGHRRPESVLVVVYAADAGILLLRRSQPFVFWQSITGSLEPGETPQAAAKRELEEETGLTNEGELLDTGINRRFVIDPRWRDRYAPGVTENLEHAWHYRLARQPEIRIDVAEHSAYRWVAFADAPGMVWSWTNREALDSLAETMT